MNKSVASTDNTDGIEEAMGSKVDPKKSCEHDSC